MYIGTIKKNFSVFKGGIVTYSNEAKIKRLGVNENTINKYICSDTISNECDIYRLVSPNYQSQFEFYLKPKQYQIYLNHLFLHLKLYFHYNYLHLYLLHMQELLHNLNIFQLILKIFLHIFRKK